MKEQLQALEAAKLAALVGGQLKKVDSLTVERNGMPANKISMESFVARVKNPNTQVQNNFSNVPHGFAPPVPEDIVQRLVPDTTIGSDAIIQHDTQAPQTHNTPNLLPEHRQSQSVIQNKPVFNQDSKTLKKINNNLKSIKLTLEQILASIKQK